MSGSIRTRKAMSKKELKAPVIPKKLAFVKDAKNILEESAEQEYEIINRLFENIFLTKIHAGHLEIKQTVFRGCRFTGCDFSETSFTNVRFVECDFSNSNFSDAYFKCCSFQKCKAVGADFYGSRINHVTFLECNFMETGFDAAHIGFVKIQDTDFTEAGFGKCRFVNFWVDNVCFRKASFFKTSLKDIDFATCDIEEIIVSDTMEELKGVKVNLAQAVSLAKRLGIIIKETENPL